MFTQEEKCLWDSQIQRDNGKVVKKHRDSRNEKLKDYRKGIKSVHFNKESKAARKEDYRKYRTQMKRLLHSERYELLRNYQRTSGWMTW